MAYGFADKMEWTLIFAAEFGRRFGLTLKQAFNCAWPLRRHDNRIVWLPSVFFDEIKQAATAY